MKGFFFSIGVMTLLVPTLYFGGSGGCGGSSSRGSSGGDTSEASADSLSDVPSVDISNLDYSQSSSSSSSLSALEIVRSGKGEGLGQNLNKVGNPSRAGCESNMHKREMIRHSQQAQLDRCYIEAMERAGLITIPADSSAFFRVRPPSEAAEQQERACEGIPEDHPDEIAACKEGGEGPSGGGDILVQAVRSSGALQVDVCEGDHGLVNEGTYSADGSVYTMTATRIGKFGGHAEAATFTGTIDLGTSGTVSDGLVDLGDGTATATASMDGGFGSGTMTFSADGTDQSNAVSGGFEGSFTDPRSKTKIPITFTGKVYARFGGASNTGTAKFSFTGAPPPMFVKDMIPFTISDSQLSNFLKTFGLQLGIDLNATNYLTLTLCPNPSFNPQNPTATANIPPMILGTASACPSVTHTGVESFSIRNGSETSNGVAEVKQVFTIIENSSSSFYDAVKDFDLSTLASNAGTIAFTRNWDCTGDFTDIDFASFTPEQMEAAATELQTCFDLENRVRRNNGMGDHNCHEQQQQGDVNETFEGGSPPMGFFGGDLSLTTGGTCPAGTGPSHLFVNTIDSSKGTYCFPLNGNCASFTVTGTSATGLTVDMGGGNTLTAISYTQSGTTPATAATITLKAGANSCTANYTMSQPKFDKPPEFNPNAGPGGGDKKPGETGFIPKSCIDAGLTSEAACRAHCQDTHDCR